MPSHSADKCAVILLGMGGPDSLDGVKPYLVNIFSDRSIIRLPGGALLQKPLAQFIARMRQRNVRSHYQLIGGKSPLLDWTNFQRDHVLNMLKKSNPDVACLVGMRYFRPFIGEAVAEAHRQGFRHICFFPMYPQYCKATTGSSFEEAGRALNSLRGMTSSFVKEFHDHPGYVELLRKYIDAHIEPDDTLLFSAHSIPVSFVEEGDPYVDQVKRTAELAAGRREYFVSFQSRTGPVKWVGPDTVEKARQLLQERPGNLFVVPISFVCDHIETLYEIDIELRELLGDSLGSRVRRMPMFNDDPQFGRVIVDIVRERIGDRVSA